MPRPKNRLAPRKCVMPVNDRTRAAAARVERLRHETADPKPKKLRRDRDAYHTPIPLAEAICRSLMTLIPEPARIIEPSAGDGSFIRGALAAWPEALVMAVDLHQPHAMACQRAGATSFLQGDWLAQDVSGFKPDLIVGNPPYSVAEAHIKKSLDGLEDGKHLAFLLPVTFLCGQDRARNLWGMPKPFGGLRYYQPIPQRPSFTDGGTDLTEYGLYVWCKGFDSNPMVLPHLWWR